MPQNFDVFNGDADGLCALHQFRLANPAQSTLVTGVKRDIQLVKNIPSSADNNITIFDISFDKNRDDVIAQLEAGARVRYFDHHFCGDIPEHQSLSIHIDTSPETCTSVIVDEYLAGKYRAWAVVGAFGDGFDDLAKRLAETINLNENLVSSYRELGNLLNYNGYGPVVDDLHFDPAALYQKLASHESPETFLNDAAFHTLKAGYEKDYEQAKNLKPELVTDKIALYILPNEKWAKRISGVFANELNKAHPERAHAMLTDLGNENYLVSVRAPAVTKEGADELCRQFETGGGRKAAAGINLLPFSDYDLFVERFSKQFS